MTHRVLYIGEHRRNRLPLLKWAGGKRLLLPSLIPLLPRELDLTTNCYYEPFAGGAAMFFHLRPPKAILSDLNADLVNCYAVVKTQPNELVNALRCLTNSELEYYKIRQSRPSTSVDKAARFYYLLALSFNGIYRENQKGDFNVPYGHKVDKEHINAERILTTHRHLQGATILEADFETSTFGAAVGDLVYLDPPYTVMHNSNGFVKYNSKIFSWSDQERLAAHAQSLADRGCYVMVSNACHGSVDNLYPYFQKHLIERASVIAASSKHRRIVQERVFTSYEV